MISCTSHPRYCYTWLVVGCKSKDVSIPSEKPVELWLMFGWYHLSPTNQASSQNSVGGITFCSRGSDTIPGASMIIASEHLGYLLGKMLGLVCFWEAEKPLRPEAYPTCLALNRRADACWVGDFDWNIRCWIDLSWKKSFDQRDQAVWKKGMTTISIIIVNITGIGYG